jgi:hypothetical protein
VVHFTGIGALTRIGDVTLALLSCSFNLQ